MGVKINNKKIVANNGFNTDAKRSLLFGNFVQPVKYIGSLQLKIDIFGAG
jgi:hypothetical protein